jgi:hypothetical protein
MGSRVPPNHIFLSPNASNIKPEIKLADTVHGLQIAQYYCSEGLAFVDVFLVEHSCSWDGVFAAPSRTNRHLAE